MHVVSQLGRWPSSQTTSLHSAGAATHRASLAALCVSCSLRVEMVWSIGLLFTPSTLVKNIVIRYEYCLPHAHPTANYRSTNALDQRLRDCKIKNMVLACCGVLARHNTMTAGAKRGAEETLL